MMQLDRQQLPDKGWDTMAEWARSWVDRTSLEQKSILRWEDDGGQATEHALPADHATPEVTMGNNRPMTLPSKEELERLQRH